MLEFRVQKRVGALDLDVALAASDETLLIAGPNGAGKSTLLRLLLGVLRPDAGRIALEGSALFDSSARVDAPPEQRRLGYVPQDYALFPHLDVEENVAFGLAAFPRPERQQRAAEWLSRLDLLPLARRSPSSLSGGERQRVALARALAREPRALLLDEPFASLDPGARRDLRASLRGWLRGWRLPALMVSHDPADAAAADRIAVLERGRLVQQGTLDELRKAPATEFVSAFQAVGA